MSYHEIRSICIVRTDSGLSCRGCRFKGRECDNFCAKHNITKPCEYKIEGGKNNGNKQGQKGK